MGRQVDRALRQATRLTRLNSELLDVSRIHAARLTLEVAEVDLGAVVRDVVARFKLDLARAGCSVSLRDSGRIVGLWDRSRVDQIVTNLARQRDQVRGGQAHRDLRRRGGRDGAALGQGSRDRRSTRRARRRSSSASSARCPTRHYGGLGLGLYISRRIAEAHGGSIRVQSAPGAGATFIVEAPRRRTAGVAARAGLLERFDRIVRLQGGSAEAVMKSLRIVQFVLALVFFARPTRQRW